MKRLMFALAGVAVVAAVAAVVFGTPGEAAVPTTAATQSFTFYSGSADPPPPTFGPNGEYPITAGLGAFGADDPVTDHLGAPSVLPGDAVIIEQNPGWGLVAGSRWISYGPTTFVGPSNGVVVTFTVDFFLPGTNPVLAVTTIQDDNVDISLNGQFEVNHAGHTQASQLTHTTDDSSLFISCGNNQLSFDVEQTGGAGFGLDYSATVTFTPTPCPVGGTTDLLTDGSDAPRSAAEGSSSGSDYTAAIAGAAALAVAVVAAGGWYARRRWMR